MDSHNWRDEVKLVAAEMAVSSLIQEAIISLRNFYQYTVL